MAIIRIIDQQQKRLRRQPKVLPEAKAGAPIKVLATGCVHCRAMRENVIEAVKELGLPDTMLECVSDLAEIARLGVMTTPSLVIDGKLLSSGKVLKVERIKELIKEHLGDDEYAVREEE